MTNILIPAAGNLKDGEILVEMVATGICHTDISLTAPEMGQRFPIVPGHEGMSSLFPLECYVKQLASGLPNDDQDPDT